MHSQQRKEFAKEEAVKETRQKGDRKVNLQLQEQHNRGGQRSGK